jgi:hypothetical protein
MYGATDLGSADERTLTQYRRDHVGFVFQFYNLSRQACAQSRQALAQVWQCSIWCLPHSAPHASQILAQSVHSSREKALFEAKNCATSRQIDAQSRSRRMQSAIIFTFGSLRHAVAQ